MTTGVSQVPVRHDAGVRGSDGVFSTDGFAREDSGDPASPANGSLLDRPRCLSCGYNLRGLIGDPVRCPECGQENEVGEAVVPAAWIRKTLRNLETAPTVCCALTVLTIGLAPWLLSGWNVLPAVVVLLVAGWGLAMIRTKQTCGNQPGWKGVLLELHVAALLGSTPLWLTVGAAGVAARTGVVFREAWAVSSMAASIPMVVLGMVVYARARRRLRILQRDVAIQIARSSLQRRIRSVR